MRRSLLLSACARATREANGLGGLESGEQTRIKALEEGQGRLVEAVVGDNATLCERLGGLESAEQKQAEALEQHMER
jgi:hypothetical protein